MMSKFLVNSKYLLDYNCPPLDYYSIVLLYLRYKNVCKQANCLIEIELCKLASAPVTHISVFYKIGVLYDTVTSDLLSPRGGLSNCAREE